MAQDLSACTTIIMKQIFPYKNTYIKSFLKINVKDFSSNEAMIL